MALPHELSIVTIAPEPCRHLEFIVYSNRVAYLMPTRVTNLTAYLHWTFNRLWVRSRNVATDWPSSR